MEISIIPLLNSKKTPLELELMKRKFSQVYSYYFKKFPILVRKKTPLKR